MKKTPAEIVRNLRYTSGSYRASKEGRDLTEYQRGILFALETAELALEQACRPSKETT